MTFQQGPNGYRFGLVMKQLGSDINDPAYFVLNADNFLKEDEVFSEELSDISTRKYVSLTSLQFTGLFDVEYYNSMIDTHYFIYNLKLDYVKNFEWFV